MLDDRKLKHDMLCSGLDAFDIISLSSGQNLSGLLDGEKSKEKRYTSTTSVEGMVERVREVGERLGYKVESGKRGVLGLGKGRLVLVVEVVKIAASFVLVEVKVAEGVAAFEERLWGDLEAELGDVVVSWHGDEVE